MYKAWLFSACIIASLSALEATAQVKSYRKISDGDNLPDPLFFSEEFGKSLAPLGDLDGDGTFELAVGSSGRLLNDTRSGLVRILSLTKDGQVVAVQRIEAPTDIGNELFGSALAAGDLDNDGTMDLVVGAEGVGYVANVFLNSDGSVRETTIIDRKDLVDANIGEAAQFGAAVAVIGDVNGDTYADIAVAAPDHEGGSLFIVFLNPLDGPVGWTKIPIYTKSLATVDDLDGDGIAELVVERYQVLETLYLNSDGTLRQSIVQPEQPRVGDSGETRVGFLQALGSGHVEMIAGVPIRENPSMTLILKKDGLVENRLLFGPETGFDVELEVSPCGSSRFGEAVTSLGDLNGDGVIDVAIGMPRYPVGIVSCPSSGSDVGEKGAVWILFREKASAPIFIEEREFPYPTAKWIDFDLDGDLDIFFGAQLHEIYRNDGPGAGGDWLFTPLSTADLGLPEGLDQFQYDDSTSTAYLDIENDGDVDLLFLGEDNGDVTAYVFQNNGKESLSFTVYPATLDTFSSLTAVDFDNDGAMDVAIGERLFRNAGLSNAKEWEFIEVQTALPDFMEQSSWADFDGDGDYDVFLISSSTWESFLFRNEGEGDSLNWSFSGQPLNTQFLGPMTTPRWGDFDNDGDLDFLMSFLLERSWSTKFYRNDGPSSFGWTFEELLSGSGQGLWADLINDGYLDVLLAGYYNVGTGGRSVQKNEGPLNNWVFSEVFSEHGDGSVASNHSIADFDRDGDLDFLVDRDWDDTEWHRATQIHKNFLSRAPRVLEPPSILQTERAKDTATLIWNSGVHTREMDSGTVDVSSGLTYNLRVGSTSEGTDILSPLSLPDGTRLVVEMGNVQQNRQWTLRNLEDGTYYWSVQSVDHSYTGSAFAPEQTFTINTTPPAAPLGLAASAGDQRITLTWNASPELDLLRYRIYRNRALIDSTDALTFTDTGLTNGIEYGYQISAVDEALNESLLSETVSATPAAGLPQIVNPAFAVTTPEGVGGAPSVDPTEAVAVTVTINDADNNVTDVYIDWLLDGAPQDSIPMTTTDNAIYSGDVPPQSVDSNVSLSVVVEDARGNRAEQAIGGYIVRPGTPGSLIATGGANEVRLSWSGATGAASYRVYRSPTSTTQPTEADLRQAGIEGVSFTDDTAQNGTAYYYHVQAISAGGNASSFSNEASTTPFVYAAQLTVAQTMNFGNATNPASYRMVSLPGDVNLRLEDTFSGAYGEAGQWRAFWDNGQVGVSAEQFLVEFAPTNSLFAFRPGVGFWVVSRGAWNVDSQSIPTVALSAANTYEIALHANWNIIANPFDRSLSWQAVRDANAGATQPVWEYTGQGFMEAQTIAPYKGYYYFSESASTLKLPYEGTQAGKAAKTEAASRRVRLLVESRSSESRAAVEAGIRAGAESGLDAYDRFAPPGYFPALTMALRNESLETAYKWLAAEYRDEVGAGQAYEIELTVKEEAPLLWLAAEGAEAFEGSQVYLVDEHLGKFYDLKVEREIVLEPETGKNLYKLLIGGADFIDEQRKTILPREYALMGSYPNPFNGATVIEYALKGEDAERVKLEVYNLLGQRVAVLVDRDQEAGYYRVQWDGTQEGSRLASGVYVYRLEVEGFQQTRPMVLVR